MRASEIEIENGNADFKYYYYGKDYKVNCGEFKLFQLEIVSSLVVYKYFEKNGL